MAIYRSEATYQGYPCQSVEWRLSDGLSPDVGHVVLRRADLKQLVIVPRFVPWRAANGIEFPGQGDMRVLGGQPGATATDPAGLPAPEDGGLNQFGDLVLTTYKGDDVFDVITYKDIQVGDSGFEEVLDDQDEPTGDVRVPITDVRKYYADYGAFFGEINTTLASGGPNKKSWDGESVYPFWKALSRLFKALPGSPVIENLADLQTLYLPPPTVVGKGEPPAQFVEELLKSCKLVAKPTPKFSYRIESAALSTVISSGKLFDGASEVDAPPLNAVAPMPALSQRPPAVIAVGKKVVRRQTLLYVPILEGEDGRYYRLEDLLTKWGYSYLDFAAQIFANEEKRFENVPPGKDAPGGGRQYSRRREILSQAYKLYAPAVFFEGENLFGGNDFPSLGKEDFESLPFLPMCDVPFYVSELEHLTTHLVMDPRQVPLLMGGDEGQGFALSPNQGDHGPYRLEKPKARAFAASQTLYHQFDELKAAFQERIAEQNKHVTFLDALIGQKQIALVNLAQIVRRAENVYLNTIAIEDNKSLYKERAGITTVGGAATTGGGIFGAPTGNAVLVGANAEITQLAKDALAAFQIAGQQFGDLVFEQIDAQVLEAMTTAARLGKEIDELKARKDAQQEKVLQPWLDRFEEFEETFKKHRAFKVLANHHYGPLPRGSFTVDYSTGILTSTQGPLCLLAHPFYLDPDRALVAGDGHVVVTVAYESNMNAMSDWTTITVAQRPAEGKPQQADPSGSPKLVVVGVNAATPVKALRVPMQAQMYVFEEGTPLNLAECAAAGLNAAAGVMLNPPVSYGYVAEHLGFRKATLGHGTQSVQHTFDGDLAKTTVVVQNPRGAGTLGAPAQKARVNTVGFNTRQEVERG